MSLPHPPDCSVDRGQGASVQSDRLTIGKSPPRLGIGSHRDPNSGIFTAGSSMDGRPFASTGAQFSAVQHLPQGMDRDFQVISQVVANRRVASPPPAPSIATDDSIRNKLEVLARDNSRLQDAHAGLISQANGLQNQLCKAVSQANLYSSTINQLNKIIHDLEAQSAVQAASNAELRDKVSELGTWNAVLKTDLQAARQERELAVSEACEFYDKLVSSQQDLAALRARLAAVERNNVDLQTRASSTDASQSHLVSALAEESLKKSEALQQVSLERERLSQALTEAQSQKESALSQRDALEAKLKQLAEDAEQQRREAEHRSQLGAIELSEAQKSLHFARFELSQVQNTQRELEGERAELALQLRVTSQQLSMVEEERKRLSAELGTSASRKQEDEEAKQRYLIDLEESKLQIRATEEEKQKLHEQIAHLFDVNRSLQELSIEGSAALKKLREEHDLKLGQLNLRLGAKDGEIAVLAEELLRSQLQLEDYKRRLEDKKPAFSSGVEPTETTLGAKSAEGNNAAELPGQRKAELSSSHWSEHSVSHPRSDQQFDSAGREQRNQQVQVELDDDMLLHYRKRIAELSAKLGATDERGSQTDLLRQGGADRPGEEHSESAADKKNSLQIQVPADAKPGLEATKETPRFNDFAGLEADSAKEEASQQTKADSKREPNSTLSVALEEKEREVRLLQTIIEDVKKQVDDRIRKTEEDRLMVIEDRWKQSQLAGEVERKLADEAAARQQAVDQKQQLEVQNSQLQERCSQLAAANQELETTIAQLKSSLLRLQPATLPTPQADPTKSPAKGDRELQAGQENVAAPFSSETDPRTADGATKQPTQQSNGSPSKRDDAQKGQDSFASPGNQSALLEDAKLAGRRTDERSGPARTDEGPQSPTAQVCLTTPADVETLLRELERVRVLLENADKSLSSKQREIEELQQRNHALHEQTLKTHELLDDSEREINLLSRSIKQSGKQSHEQELKSLRSLLASRQTELDYYKQKVEELSGLESVHTRLLDANSTVANLTIKLREASFEVDNLTVANRELRDRASELENDLIEKDMTLVQANDAVVRAAALESEVASLAEANHQLQTDLRQAKGQLSIEADQTGKLLRKVEATEEELRLKRQECDQLRRDISEIRARADEMSSELLAREDAALEFKPLADASQASAESYAHLRAAYSRDASQLKKLTEHNRRLCEAYVAQKSELQSLQDSINKLKVDYHTVCQEFSRVNPDFSSSMPSLFKPLPLEPATADSQ